MKGNYKRCVICYKEIRSYMPIFMCCDMCTCSRNCSINLLERILEYDSKLSSPEEWREIHKNYQRYS